MKLLRWNVQGLGILGTLGDFSIHEVLQPLFGFLYGDQNKQSSNGKSSNIP